MSGQLSRIHKKDGKPSEFEYHVAQTLGEIEASASDLKADLKNIVITGATEFEGRYKGVDRSSVIIMVHYKSLAAVKKVHARLVSELEKRFARPVALIFQRNILPKYLKSKGQQKRPYSRTLTQVHESILEDILFPITIMGRRMRIKCDGKRVFKVLLDPLQREQIENKLDFLAAIYRKLTNKDVNFEFPKSREFPV